MEQGRSGKARRREAARGSVACDTAGRDGRAREQQTRASRSRYVADLVDGAEARIWAEDAVKQARQRWSVRIRTNVQANEHGRKGDLELSVWDMTDGSNTSDAEARNVLLMVGPGCCLFEALETRRLVLGRNLGGVEGEDACT